MIWKKCHLVLLLLILFFPSITMAFPPMPARIAGSLTVDGVLITQETDSGYTFIVTKEDGTLYDPTAEDTDGLNSYNRYIINIPIYHPVDQPGGAQPGEIAVLHVYKDGKELKVKSPVDGKFTVGDSGSITGIDCVASNNPPGLIPAIEILLFE